MALGQYLKKHRMVKHSLCLIILAITVWVCFIFNLSLRKDHNRDWGDYPLNKSTKDLVLARTSQCNNPDDIINECCKIAIDNLTFSKANDIPNGKANCIGYARFTSAILNYAFANKDIDYKAQPVVGTVYSFGLNLNMIAQYILPHKWRPFFKDHDFVEVRSKYSTIYIDTSLQDISGRQFIVSQ